MLRVVSSIFFGRRAFACDYLTITSKLGATERIGNNIIVKQPHFDPSKPTFMLNSYRHCSSCQGLRFDPFNTIKRMFTDWVNDAGRVLYSVATFLHFYNENLLSIFCWCFLLRGKLRREWYAPVGNDHLLLTMPL